jgi:hypothetical protein
MSGTYHTLHTNWPSCTQADAGPQAWQMGQADAGWKKEEEPCMGSMGAPPVTA